MSLYIGNQKVTPTIMPSLGGVNMPLEVTSNGDLRKPTSSFTWSLPANVKSISGNRTWYYTFYKNTYLTSVDLSSLKTISGEQAMLYAFYQCTGLTSVDFSGLTTLSGDYDLQDAFYQCTSLTSVDFSNLSTITGEGVLALAFYGCTGLKNLSFPSLNSNSFGSNTDQFDRMLDSITGCTVHFPSNLQSVIGSWSSVTNGFGGTNTTVLFDLPATT